MGRVVSRAFAALVFALGVEGQLRERQPDTTKNEPTSFVTDAGASQAEVSAIAISRRLKEERGGVCTGTEQNEQVSVEVGEYTLKTKFTCSSHLDALSPAYSNPLTECHNTPQCSSKATIASVLNNKGGKLTKETQNNVYTLSLIDMPSNRTTKMYYKCGKDGSPNSCIVTVTLPAEPKPNECTISKKIGLKVEKPGDAAFLCPNSSNRLSDTTVLTGEDCKAEEDLRSVLPGAKLTVVEASKTYTLSVPTLPPSVRTLCYECEYEAPGTSEESVSPNCLVRITVSAAATSTTTAATGASVPVASAVSGAALGAVVAGTVAAY